MNRTLASRFHVQPPKPTLELVVKSWARPLISLLQFIRVELRTRHKLPLRKRIRSWQKGFFTEAYSLYDLDRNDPSQYLPGTACLDYMINDPHYRTLHNKLSFSRLMEFHG
jgi:hypothetical protein